MGIGPSKPRYPTFWARHFFECLQIACTKPFTVELMDVSWLCDLNEKKVEELLYLQVFVWVLEVKYDLDSTGMKIQIKTAKIACIGMWPRMQFLDLQQLDRCLNGCVRPFCVR